MARRTKTGRDLEISAAVFFIAALVMAGAFSQATPPPDWRKNAWDLGDWPHGGPSADWIESVPQPTPTGAGADIMQSANPGLEGGSCSNGADDDGDGLADAEDPDCLSLGPATCWAGYYSNATTAAIIGLCVGGVTPPPTWTPGCDPSDWVGPGVGTPWDLLCTGSSIHPGSPISSQWCNQITWWPANDEGTHWFGPGSRTDPTSSVGLLWTTAMPMPTVDPAWPDGGAGFPGLNLGDPSMAPCGGWIDSTGPHYDGDGDGY
jgi:hypothetical protein